MAAPAPASGNWYDKPLITSDRYPGSYVKSYIGATLTATAGNWATNALPFTDAFQWKKNGTDISGATTNTLVLADADFDVGDVVRCDVTRTNDDGSATNEGYALTIITSVPVNVAWPSISPGAGGVILSATVFGEKGVWEGWPVPTLTYQWRKNGADISGATALNLALSAHAIGDSIVLREIANNSAGGPITRDSAAVVIMPDFHVPANTRLPQTHDLDVNEVWDITLLGETQVFIDGAFVGWTKPGTNTKSFRFAQAGTYTISTTNPVEKCVVTVT